VLLKTGGRRQQHGVVASPCNGDGLMRLFRLIHEAVEVGTRFTGGKCLHVGLLCAEAHAYGYVSSSPKVARAQQQRAIERHIQRQAGKQRKR